MKTFLSRIAGALLLTAGVGLAHGADLGAALSGNQEVPPVMTTAYEQKFVDLLPHVRSSEEGEP